MIVVVSEPLQPSPGVRLAAPPERVKSVDPHRHRLKPLFDVVSITIVQLTAQFSSCRGSQIAASIDEKLCIVDIVFLSEPVQERRRGIGPAAAVDVDIQQ